MAVLCVRARCQNTRAPDWNDLTLNDSTRATGTVPSACSGFPSLSLRPTRGLKLAARWALLRWTCLLGHETETAMRQQDLDLGMR
jgi:hypothetical protein